MFKDACSLVETVMTGTAREEILDEVAKPGDFARALARLRDRMRTNAWKLGARSISLDHIVKKYDSDVRQTGFHVLHDWDGKADRINDDTIPIDVLNYFLDQRGAGPLDRRALAVLLDYHFVHVLALLAMKIWDEGDPDANLDCLNRLLAALQGPHGSSQAFVDNAETLLLIATSHYERDERGFNPLLDKVRTLNRTHQANIALSHAAAMGSHLRFGFEATYGRDTVLMRDDNVVDYPWLCFALVTLMREFARGSEPPGEERIVEAMLNGLTGDARAFVGTRPPGSLATCEADRGEFCARFEEHHDDLLQRFERHRPSRQTYSPLSFFFNFSHNILKGTIVDALLRAQRWALTFNDLLTGLPREEAIDGPRQELATTLMDYARAHPDRIRGQWMPVIVYDPQAGRRAFNVAMKKLIE